MGEPQPTRSPPVVCAQTAATPLAGGPHTGAGGSRAGQGGDGRRDRGAPPSVPGLRRAPRPAPRARL
eukprot:2573055-Prymnesium_polylepis.1